MAKPATKGLGKGLSALMGDSTPVAAVPVKKSAPGKSMAIDTAEGPISALPTKALTPGKYQPRRHFDEAHLQELADSIVRHGLMQPIVVRKLKGETYEIIAGERRWRAAQMAKFKEVPVIVREVNDSEALELGLIENIQRADLNPLEEAAGYQRLMDEFGYTQEKLAPVVGKSRSHVANLLRLLKLPASIKKHIDSGELSMGHARALLLAKNPEEIAEVIVKYQISVRQTEALAKGLLPMPGQALAEELSQAAQSHLHPGTPRPAGGASKSRSAGAPAKNDDVLQLESMLAENLGLRVSISQRSGMAGEVVISYDTLVQLDDILRRLGGGI